MSRWITTVRAKGRITRERFATFDEAVAAAEGHAARATLGPGARTVDLKVREYAPDAQVTTRVEVSGPGRLLPAVRAGLDVRGDGSIVAWSGRVQRSVIEPHGSESAAEALRRVVSSEM